MAEKHCTLCDKPVLARGWCSKHYDRWRRHGNPNTTVRSPKGSLIAWLSEVVIDPSHECILWPFPTTQDGYGTIKVRGISMNAHRAALIMFSGEPPTSRSIARHGPCNNRMCVNPRHIEWGTISENNGADRVRDGTSMRGERNTVAKLTESDVLAIRKDTRKLSEISSHYGISLSNASAIRRRLSWSWLE